MADIKKLVINIRDRNQLFIIVDRCHGITNGTHYPNLRGAAEDAEQMAMDNPENEYFVCAVESRYRVK